MNYVFITAGLLFILYGAFFHSPGTSKTASPVIKRQAEKEHLPFEPTVMYSRSNEDLPSLLLKYHKLPKRQGADLDQVILKEKAIIRDAPIDSLQIEGRNKFQVLIDERGWPEAIILMRPLHPYLDSLSALAIKQTHFQPLMILNRPSKYFLLMGYAFTAKPVFHPVVYNPISNEAPASKVNGEVMEFFAVTDKPLIIKKDMPIYPDLARKSGIEGTVVVTITIGKTGQVENAEIIKSIPMLDAAALDAAYRCRFKPAKVHGKIVRVKMNIPFKFKLK